MAMYEYQCNDCGSSFELLRSMSQDDSDVTCKSCGSPKVQRKISLFASTIKEGGSSMADFGDSCSTGTCGCNGSSCSY